MKKKLKLFAFLSLLLLVGLFLVVECSYRVLTYDIVQDMAVHSELSAVSDALPSYIMKSIWISFDEKLPMDIQPIMTWDILLAPIMADPFDNKGAYINGHLSRLLLAQHNIPDKALIRHMKEVSLSIWLSRNWTAEQSIMETSHHLYFGDNCRGIANASQKLLNKRIADLNIAEIALLMAIAHYGRSDYPIEKLTQRRNQIVQRIFDNGLISEPEYKQAINSPVDIR
jgi:hypothetical protein